MKSGSGQHFEQAYNAQAAVEADSRLIIAGQLVDASNDKEQLAPVIESVGTVLVDSGFYSEAAVKTVEEGTASGALAGAQVLAATERHKHGRRIADLEIKTGPPELPKDALFIEQMKRRLQTSEPIFGVIKEALGFRRFSLRGLSKVNLEWKLVSLSYNLKRLFHLGARMQSA